MTRPARTLVARLDNLGDVLLAGPAVRAVAASGQSVTVLCGPNGRPAAELLPGVSDIIEFRAPWIDPDGYRVTAGAVGALVEQVSEIGFADAAILTSFHQSPLPLALLLRLAGVDTIAAISPDYPGTLLDIRHAVADYVHEVVRNLSLVATLGYELPPADAGRLAVCVTPAKGALPFDRPYVVVHPGASVPARSWGLDANRAAVDALVQAGWAVAVTGGLEDADLTRLVASTAPARPVVDLGGRTSLAELAVVLAGAAAVVVGNTGAAHLAAAVGTPVVSLYAPTVPLARWHPWGVDHVVLGDQLIGCAGCRARQCPVVGHPCLSGIQPRDVVAAVGRLSRQPCDAGVPA